ncbi:hypothetical protein F0562_008434 [Nyssa sinensis]|uniref:3'-5' exonuclease domain-containing protein n=1 Tax=Nyssa sinensis TaxID=561372 RepID=A0A5J5A666_9ASTE|nr:hypothetical protein F0562_008434 [Nyssa sinensis]
MTIGIQKFDLPYFSLALYDVTFFGDTIKTLVTATPSIVDTWISDMERLHSARLHKLIVGLDIEWRPGPNPAATLQLCVGRNCLIFQLIVAPEIPQSLRNFLMDDDYTFVGVGIDKDVQKLQDDYGLDVSNTVDLCYLAASKLGENWLGSAGLARLAGEVLGKNFEKPRWVTLSDWDDAWLSHDQIQSQLQLQRR